MRYKIPRDFEFTTEPLRDDAGKIRRSALRAERIAGPTTIDLEHVLRSSDLEVLMATVDFDAFDADNHYYEATDAFTRHLPASTARSSCSGPRSAASSG